MREAVKDHLNRTITECRPVEASQLSIGCNDYLCESGLGGVFHLRYLGRKNAVCAFSVDNKYSDFHGKRLSWKPENVPANVWIEVRRPMPSKAKGGAK